MTTYTVTATATDATTDTITVSSATNMFSGLPIVFSGTVFGGITAGATYYIGTVVPGSPTSTITVTSLPGGAIFALTTAAGSMTGTFNSGGQQIIDIGSVPNDGTGDPLRTAFNDTNVNFDQVFAAGPVGSNVQIVNNTIKTINTNGNLVLAPNGTGVVQSNVTIVPNTANVRNLGSAAQRWSTIYTQYLDISGTLTTGDLTVDGNLTVQGNIIQVGNIVTETLTIQLANAASTANAANGAGITVGANDNIATMLYSSTSNTWTTNIGLSSVGNISAPYLFGNGSQLTGLAATYGNANVVAYGESGWAGNIVPSGNAVYSLGNATNQWNDLYVSNATIFMNNVPVGLSAGNVLTVNGNAVLQNDSNTSIATTGTITANVFATATSNLTIGPIDLVLTDPYTYIRQSTANGGLQVGWDGQPDNDGIAYITFNDPSAASITLWTGNANTISHQWSFLNEGTFIGYGNINTTGNVLVGNIETIDISATGNITANYFVGNGSQLTGLAATYGNANVANYLPTFSGNISAGNVSATGNITAGNIGITGSSLTWANASIVQTSASDVSITGDGQVTVRSLDGTYQWTFESTGNLTLPGATAGETIATQGGYITVGNLLVGQGGALFNSNNDSWALYGNISDPGATIFIPSNADAGNGTPLYIESQQSNVEIRSGSSTWNFDTTGNLALPQGGVVYETNIPDGGLNGKTIALKPQGGTNADQQLLIYPTVNDANHLHLTSGNLYNTELFLGDDNLYVKLANTGNIVVNSNDAVGNSAQWTFGADGNLTVPGGMIINGNINTLGSQTALLQPTDDLPLAFIASGANGSVISYWAEDIANLMTSNIAAIYTPLQNTQTVRIVTGSNGGNIAIYDFDKDGVFTTAQVSATGNVTGNYFIGNGSLLTGISASLPVANGTSNFDIATANGNATITANSASTWTFGTDSALTLPASSGQIGRSGYPNGIDLYNNNGGTGYVRMNYADESLISADSGGAHVQTTGGTWDFDTTGNLTAPGNVSATGNVTAGNVNTGMIALTNGATIKNTAGNAIAIGRQAGETSQGSYATAIGFGAGGTSQGTDAIAIGGSAGSTSQGNYGVSMGYLAGQNTQGAQAVAIGLQTGGTSQGAGAVALGTYSGRTGQGTFAVAIGYLAGNTTQGNNSVAMGRSAGETTQGTEAVAIGLQAGFTAQGNYAVAIGKFSANSSQGEYAVAVGPNAGFENQLANAVAIGSTAGASSQGINSVAIGVGAAYNTQGNSAVAVGNSAGYLLQGLNSVAIGDNAGFALQGPNNIAIGYQAGNTSQTGSSVAIGHLAAANVQGFQSVAIGIQAGYNSQLDSAVAIGASTGANTQGDSAVAIGRQAGQTLQGTSAVAIGRQAGQTSQGNNSIILNATGSALNQTTANTFTVKPVRGDSTANLVSGGFKAVYYNSTTGEFCYSTD